MPPQALMEMAEEADVGDTLTLLLAAMKALKGWQTPGDARRGRPRPKNENDAERSSGIREEL